MAHIAVVKTGGKQYLVKENQEILVDRLDAQEKDIVELETLAVFEEDGNLELGMPALTKKTQATVVEQLRGDKIRVAHFKAKVRYRKVRGFRADLTKLKIGAIA